MKIGFGFKRLNILCFVLGFLIVQKHKTNEFFVYLAARHLTHRIMQFVSLSPLLFCIHFVSSFQHLNHEHTKVGCFSFNFLHLKFCSSLTINSNDGFLLLSNFHQCYILKISRDIIKYDL